MSWTESSTSPEVLKQLLADRERHRPLPASAYPGAVVGGCIDIGEGGHPFICTIVRVEGETVWLHVPGPIRPRLQYTLTGVKR